MKKAKTITGKHLGFTYRRNKSHFDTEAKALQSILKCEPQEREKNLDPFHSEKQWIFKAKTII